MPGITLLKHTVHRDSQVDKNSRVVVEPVESVLAADENEDEERKKWEMESAFSELPPDEEIKNVRMIARRRIFQGRLKLFQALCRRACICTQLYTQTWARAYIFLCQA
jgi:hypothetical protein